MGKILVIRDADFSENSVDVLPVYYNGSYSPNDVNYKNHFHKAPIHGGTDWSAGNASYDTFSYPVKKGSVVSFGPGGGLYDILLTTSEGGYSEPIDYMSGQKMHILRPHPNVASLLATEDGFLMNEFTPSMVPFPSDVLVKRYDQVSREMTPESADFVLSNLYMRIDGSYGDSFPVGGNASSFFSVFKGEKVEITAQADKVCVYALVSSFPASDNAYPQLLPGETRQTLSAGSSVTITIPEDCMLYVWTLDVSTNYFPASISVTRVEL